MPEGDTAHLTARRLDRVLREQVLTAADLRVPRFATSDLTGRRVLCVIARGKHLLHRIEGELSLHTHLKMEGSWHIYRAGQRWRRPAFQARAVLGTERFQTVGFSLGVVALLDTRSEDEVIGHLGPDLLGPDWDAAEARRRLDTEPARAIGDALLDQTAMAGLGNVYRCDVCFLAGIHPDTAVGDCDVARIVSISKRVIEVNRETGTQITTGDRRPGRDRWVYGRRTKPCRRCATPIVKRGGEPAERVTYWCPTCQPVAATDRWLEG